MVLKSTEQGENDESFFIMWNKATRFLHYKGWLLVRRTSLILENLYMCKQSPAAMLNRIASTSASSELQSISSESSAAIKELCAALRNWIAWTAGSEENSLLFDQQLDELMEIGTQLLNSYDPISAREAGRKSLMDIVNLTMAYDPKPEVKAAVKELVKALAIFIDLRFARMSERLNLLKHAQDSGFAYILYANYPNFNNEDEDGYEAYDVRLAAVLDGEDWLPDYEQDTDEDDTNSDNYGLQILDS